MSSSPEEAAWPLELARLQRALRAPQDAERRDAVRGALWRLLFEALLRHLRAHTRAVAAERADLEDIASEKALEMMIRAESGAWDLAGRTPAEIAGYVATAARYGWIDFARRSARETHFAAGEVPDDVVASAPVRAGARAAAPPDGAECRELIDALRDCVSRLPDRERRVWFLRAYHEWSSRDIAAHPAVGLKAPHVDVVVQRARQALRRCLRVKGHASEDAPPHAFVELWDLLESMARQADRPEARPPDDRT